MKFTLEDAHEFGWNSVHGRTYNTKDDFPVLSSSILSIEGQHGQTRSESSDRLYFILKGEGEITIEGETYSVQESDCVVVQKGEEHNMAGNMQLFVVNTPAYDPAFDVQEQRTTEGIKKLTVYVED